MMVNESTSEMHLPSWRVRAPASPEGLSSVKLKGTGKKSL